MVICSKNRSAALLTALERFAALQSDPDWEMVVVDDGSTDDTVARLQGPAAVFGARLIVRQTGGVGLGAARNVGWRAGSGQVVLFTDDDCYPAEDLLVEIRRCFADPSVAFAGGRLLPFTPEDGAVAVVHRMDRVEISGPQFIPAGTIPGANLSVLRSALEQVSGFDDELGAGTPFPAEDVDLVARLAWAGFRGVYDPGLVVYHHHGRWSLASQQQLLRSYDLGRGAYYGKCLTDSRMRPVYLRAWASAAWKGSWRRTGRELLGAVRYWIRPRH